MITIRIDTTSLRDGARKLGAMPAQVDRARLSAMKSTGWMAMTELRNHVEYGGTNWKPLHPMTLKYRKRKSGVPPTPLFWLGRFARYRVTPDGTLADIDFGKSKAGAPGTSDPALTDMVHRHERGLKIPVTEKMRRFMGATRPKGRRGKRAVAGRDYFPLRKSTSHITIPARHIFDPVWNKVAPKVPRYFSMKFNAAIERYMKGTAKT